MRIQNKIMLGAVIFVLCAAAAYAQVTVSSIPVTTARSTGRAELAGSVRVTATAATPAGDTFTVRYGIPVTNDSTTGISISIGGGLGAGCTIAGVDNTNGIVTITGCPAAGGANQYFELDGVRVSLDGYAGTSVNATVGALLTTITAGQTQAVVIQSIAAGMVDGQTTTLKNTTATVLANATNLLTSPAKLFVKEGFASAFKSLTEEGTGASQATQILLTVSGLPTGVTVAVASGAGTSSGTLTATFSAASFTSLVTTSAVTITGDSQSAVETLEFDFTPSFTTPTLPLATTSYTVAATLTPNDAALSTTSGVFKSGTPPTYKAPKFAVSNLSGTVLTVLPASTSMLIPYASTQATYDTAIAIANTTTDPFGATTGGAAAQNGAITFYFYPNDGTTIASYTTSATSPGSGLTTSGVLNSGSTYTVGLTKLLQAAAPTRTAPFSGYIIAVVNATDCHGISYITNYSGFTSFSPLLVIPNPGGTARTSLADEKLAF